MKNAVRAGLICAVWAGSAHAQDAVMPAQPDLPRRTVAATGGDASVQAAPILTVDQDRLFTESRWGLRTQTSLEDRGQQISAENERLADRLSTEEAELTAQRATLDAAEFRRLAEAFDKRATQVRRERAQAVQDLNQWAEADRNAFYRAALPLMGEAMQDRGAMAVLDRRTVFVSLDAIDITNDLVARLNRELGDGQGEVPMPDAETPAATTPD